MIANNKLKTILNQLDIIPNEIKFYFTSFKLGESTVGEIAKAAKMNRSSCYNTLGSLKQKN